ncbi:MAG: LuxR family transcriptional regulator [Sulfitobacter sp.]|nr:LuxR family transcriptional regulator [Sulfitobacter sp.]
MSLRTYLDTISKSPSLEELWDVHTQKMAEYGFDRLLYGFTRYRTPTSLGDPDDFVILTNLCPEYTNGFLRGGLYRDAPMVKWALENEGACSWAVLSEALASEQLTPKAQEVLQFNARFGVTAGYTVSFKTTSERAKGAIALIAAEDMGQRQADQVWARHGADIQLMNEITHLKILSLPHQTPARALTNRQRETLQWVGDGKTTQDIALLMGLTPATVEKHLRLAREALSVETTAQAVLKAAFANQMFVVDAPRN